MKCINFDRAFQDYLKQWMDAHRDQYKDYDAMEEAVPDVYADFLDTPADWLDGEKPGEYFTHFDDPVLLVDWMTQYLEKRLPVPDMLMNRIADLGLQAESALMLLLTREKATNEMQKAAISLLREINSDRPLELYVNWQTERTAGEENELADLALESLASLEERALPAMRKALPLASQDGQEAMLTLLCHYPGDESTLQTALTLLREHPERAAILASCLSQLGDERALPDLMRLASGAETPYEDYIELRNAIEVLGGEAPERMF